MTKKIHPPTVFLLLGILLVLACGTGSAQAATNSLFAAPSALGSGDCSSPADACSVTTAVTIVNGAPITGSFKIELAGGVYSLTTPTPTALPITFAGSSLTLEAEDAGSTPTLDGNETVRVLSVGANSTVKISGLAIIDGVAPVNGGGIENAGVLSVEDSTFTGNSAKSGGAISNVAGADLTVEDSTLSGNTGTEVGGGAILDLGTATVARSAMIENHARNSGGAINVQPSGSVTIAGSTLAGNVTEGFGGAMSSFGKLDVVGSTIMGNSAPAGAVLATAAGEVTFAADIIAAQAAGEACSPSGTALIDGGYNLDVDGTCISASAPATGSHNGTTPYGSSTYGEVLEAYLADGLADNGGPTETVALQITPNPATSLPDPAFNVVPPTFELPTPVDGASTACSLPDQRGTFPLAGADCAIGSYLLQPTTTEVSASAPEVVQGDTVTYTATVTPAPDGGTVSFDDGAGNPASVQCAAQSVSAGKATCTVSYASTGDFSADATYSGDGDKNSFVGSASAGPATVSVRPAPSAPASTSAQAPSTAAPKVRLKISYSPNHPHSPNPAGGPRYTFHFTAQGIGVSFYCRLDKAPFGRCRPPKVYKNLKRGPHVFKVKARDATGQYSPVRTVKFVAGRRANG